MRGFLFACFVLGLLLAVVIMSADNSVHQIAGLIVLLGAGIAFCTAAVIERLDAIRTAFDRLAAPSPKATDQADAPPTVTTESNDKAAELGRKVAAWIKW